MARGRRYDEQGGYYHVTQSGLDDLPLFANDEDCAFFLSFLGRVTLRDLWLCFAFVVMSTHYHLVVQRMNVPLARSVGWLNAIYARAFNGRRARSGHVFGGRYRVSVIKDERHLVEACRYVELNPVRAGMCEDPADWPWSSYRANAGLCERPPFLSSGAVDLVGGDWAAFVAQAPREKKCQAR